MDEFFEGMRLNVNIDGDNVRELEPFIEYKARPNHRKFWRNYIGEMEDFYDYLADLFGMKKGYGVQLNIEDYNELFESDYEFEKMCEFFMEKGSYWG